MAQPYNNDNNGDHVDRISELSDNVIDCILNVRDLVRTSILSRKWRYMWTSVPRIMFGYNFFDLFENLDDPSSEFSRIITEILFLHNGSINEFILYLPSGPKNQITFEYINKWILGLSRKGVKHIYLDNNEEDSVRTPSHLFSCQRLTYFKLRNFSMSITPNFCCFKSLLRLHLQFMTFESGAPESLLPGCPLIEKLDIVSCYGYECIDISSSTLTDLTVSIEDNCIFRLNESLQIIQRLHVELAHELINLTYLRLDDVNLDEREELLYIVSVLKSASNLVEFRIGTYLGSGSKKAPDPSEKLECNCCCLSELQEVNITVISKSKHAMSLARFILANSSSLRTLTFNLPFDIQSDAPIVSSISRDLLRME